MHRPPEIDFTVVSALADPHYPWPDARARTDAAALIAEDIRMLRKTWKAHAEGFRINQRAREPGWVWSLLFSLVWGFAGFLFAAQGLPPLGAMGIGFAFAAAALFAVRTQGKEDRTALRVCLARCWSCGYDLCGIESATPPDLGVELGPRRCPECGHSWPSIPPTPPKRIWAEHAPGSPGRPRG